MNATVCPEPWRGVSLSRTRKSFSFPKLAHMSSTTPPGLYIRPQADSRYHPAKIRAGRGVECGSGSGCTEPSSLYKKKARSHRNRNQCRCGWPSVGLKGRRRRPCCTETRTRSGAGSVRVRFGVEEEEGGAVEPKPTPNLVSVLVAVCFRRKKKKTKSHRNPHQIWCGFGFRCRLRCLGRPS